MEYYLKLTCDHWHWGIFQGFHIRGELIKKMAELGFLGISFPEEYGGGGMGEAGYCLMQEEIARGCMSTATFIGAHQSIGANAIYVGGSEAQKKKYLTQLASGEKIGSLVNNRSHK